MKQNNKNAFNKVEYKNIALSLLNKQRGPFRIWNLLFNSLVHLANQEITDRKLLMNCSVEFTF